MLQSKNRNKLLVFYKEMEMKLYSIHTLQNCKIGSTINKCSLHHVTKSSMGQYDTELSID